MRGYEALASALAAEGVRMVFTVMAEDTMDMLTEAADKWGIRVISVRNEHGATAMADGYARATGKPGVCVVTCGPGFTNAATALTTANRHGSPVVCITGECPVVDRHYIKANDQRRLAEATAGTYFGVRHSDTIAEDMQQAFRHVLMGKGPAVLAVPRDIMACELDMEWDYRPSSAVTAAPQRVYPDPELVAKAARMLREAKRPVILVGRGAVASKADEEVKVLAGHIGALLATTLQAQGYLSGHPFSVGVAGLFATNTGHSLLADADCVLAVGASLNLYTTESGLLFSKARVIHVDSDPDRIGRVTPVALGIVADAKATLAALGRHMEGQDHGSQSGLWNDDVKRRIAASRNEPEIPYVHEGGVVDPRELVAGIDKALPADRIVVTDGGYFRRFVYRGMSPQDPDSLVWTSDFGSIGMGLPIAVGMALARPDRHVALFIGDGGFMMGMEDLDTAVRYRVPMTVIVMNDNAFGAEVHYMEERKRPYGLAFFDNPDLAEVARALGAVGLTVRNKQDMETVANSIGKGSVPVLVDVKINGRVIYNGYRGVALSPDSAQKR